MAYTPQYTPADMGALSHIEGDPAAETWDKFDLGGNLLWDFGGQVKNKEIDKKIAQIQEMKSKIGEDRFNIIMEAVQKNGGDWDALNKAIFGETGQKLDEQYAGFQKEDQGALQDLLGGLKDYKDPTDLYKDPSFFGDVGDIQGYQGPSAGTKAAQQSALSQFKTLSTPTETAEEKLIRMMANREMEANLQGDREALNRSLKARGVYGSGAEITGNMMSQGQQADRAALSNATANAQASKRAMEALGSYSDLASGMRKDEANEGTIAQDAAKFNNLTNQNTSNQRSSSLQDAVNSGNTEQRQRLVVGNKATTDTIGNKRNDLGTVNTTKTNMAQGGINNNLKGTGMITGALDKEEEELGKLGASLASQKSSGGILG